MGLRQRERSYLRTGQFKVAQISTLRARERTGNILTGGKLSRFYVTFFPPPVLRLQTFTYISSKYELLGCKEMKGLQVHCLYFLVLDAVFYVASLEEGDSISTLGE